MLTEHPGYDGEIYLDTAKEAVKCNVKIENTRYLTIGGIGRQGISIYAFNKLMLSNYVESVLPKEEYYFFSGPNLGLYHDTQDPREGPYVNHGIENLNIQIFYGVSGTTILLKGTADLSKSGMDPYWYSGRKTGFWGFSLQFRIPKS
jgi:hypothetical protein